VHKTYMTGGGDHWQAKCTCKQKSPIGPHAEAAEWEWRHRRDAQTALAHLARTPSLRQQRDWYQTKALDPATPPSERVLWQSLADELTARLPEPDTNQLELW
jgi:hypothetical protein